MEGMKKWVIEHFLIDVFSWCSSGQGSRCRTCVHEEQGATFYEAATLTQDEMTHYVGNIKRSPARVYNSKYRLWSQTLNSDFLGGPVIKNPPASAGDLGSIPVQVTKIQHASVWSKKGKKEKSLKKFNNCPKIYRCDAMIKKKSECQCRRHKRWGLEPWVRKIPRRRKWQPIPVFLPGKSYGQSSLAGYSACCRKRVGYDLASIQTFYQY